VLLCKNFCSNKTVGIENDHVLGNQGVKMKFLAIGFHTYLSIFIFSFFLILFFFNYSYVHTMLGSFLLPYIFSNCVLRMQLLMKIKTPSIFNVCSISVVLKTCHFIKIV
jgi:hypothetical protein